MSHSKKNIEKIQAILRKKNINYLVLTENDPYNKWLNAPEGLTIIPKKGTPHSLVNPLSTNKKDSWIIIRTKRQKNILKKLLDGKKTAVNERVIPLKLATELKKENIKIVGLQKELQELRRTKEPDELRAIKRSAELTNEMFKEIADRLKRFKTEKEISQFIKRFAVEHGCELSFNPIVASGVNASQPHYEKNDDKLRKGFLVIDAGLKKNNYCADMTRTFYIGKPSPKEKRLYNKVRQAQRKAIKATIPGVQTGEIDRIARDALGTGLKEEFIHGLGHGVGVEVHEAPTIRPREKTLLKEDEVITIEPGVYNKAKGYGIRIEDMIVVKEKPQILTKMSRELISTK